MTKLRQHIHDFGQALRGDPVRWLISCAALVLLFLLGWRALSLVHGYDAAAFHLPYAARIAGLCGDDCLQLMSNLEHRFDHIPKFGHYLFAGMWLLTGSASATALVNFLALVSLVAYLQWVFRVHWGLAVVAFVAIPFVSITTTIFTTDLLPSVLVVIGLFTVLDYLLNPESFTRRRAVLGLLALMAASATKLQVYPVALMAIGIFALVVAYRGYYGIPNAFAFRPALKNWGLLLVFVLIAFSLTSVWQMRNAVVHGNPLYPVSVSVFGAELPGRFSGRVSLSEQHIDNPPLVRWAASVFEYRAYDQRFTPWTSTQGNVPRDAWSFRIGGFNGVYVLTLALFLLYMLRYNTRPAERWKIAAFLGVFTLAFMFMPASYYLRYYIWWMLLFVGVALIVAEPAFRGVINRKSDAIALFRGMIVICCLSALLISGFRFVTPGGFLTVESWVDASGITRKLEGHTGPDDVVCVRSRQAIYYTRIFQEDAEHRVVQLHPRDYRRPDDEIRDRFGCTLIPR